MSTGYTRLRGRMGEGRVAHEDIDDPVERSNFQDRKLKEMKADYMKDLKRFLTFWISMIIMIFASIWVLGVENHPIVAPGAWFNRDRNQTAKAEGRLTLPTSITERDVELKHLLPGAKVTSQECGAIAKHLGMRSGAYLDSSGRCQMITPEYPLRAVAPKDDGYDLVLLEGQNEVCLDGSPAGYYIKKGDPSKWTIHLQGGGWCISEADCLERSGAKGPACPDKPSWGHESTMGSSRCWPKHGLPPTDGGGKGINGGNPEKNPEFHSYTKVWVMYCDGGSFSGTREQPVEFEGRDLHFKGRMILEGVIKSLMKDKGLEGAEQALITGTSAGGLGLLLALDRIKELLPPAAKVAGLVDGGMFIDTVDATLGPGYSNLFRRVYNMQMSRVHPDCAESGKGWKCMLSGYAAPYVKTPTFLVQSLYDTWQTKNIMHLDCAGKTGRQCDSEQEKKALDELYDKTLKESMPLAKKQGNGGFLWSCYAHAGAVLDGSWSSGAIEQVKMRDAVTSWWNKFVTGSSGSGTQDAVTVGCKRPCDVTCPGA